MTARNLGLLAAALLLSSTPFAQQADKNLTRLFNGDEISENGVADPDAWRERLTQSDLALRETELDRFLAIARRDADARALLSDWAADESGGELAWTARLALRELEREQPSLGMLPLGGSRSIYSMPKQFGLLPEQLEELMESFGSMSMPLYSQPFGGHQGGSGSWSWSSPPSRAEQEHSSRAVELSITPDGVRCKVTEEVDGEERTSEYEAKTMEELLAAHPELSDTLQVDVGDPFKGLGRSWPWAMQSPMPDGGSGELRTDILGVYVHPLTKEESSLHGLAEGTGLCVDRTMPGTIASTLGIQRGHILLEINDRPVNRHEAISEVLCDRPAEGELRLRIIDNWGRERTCVWRPNGKHDSGGDDLPRGRQF